MNSDLKDSPAFQKLVAEERRAAAVMGATFVCAGLMVAAFAAFSYPGLAPLVRHLIMGGGIAFAAWSCLVSFAGWHGWAPGAVDYLLAEIAGATLIAGGLFIWWHVAVVGGLFSPGTSSLDRAIKIVGFLACSAWAGLLAFAGGKGWVPSAKDFLMALCAGGMLILFGLALWSHLAA